MRERRPSDLVDYAVQRNLTLAELEREYIQRVMKEEGGNKTRAAQRLGLDRKTLYRKLEETSRPEIGTASDTGEESTPRPSDPGIAPPASPDDE